MTNTEKITKRCSYGDAHAAALTFTWVQSSGEDDTKRQTHVCEAHAKHVHARVTAPRDTHGRPYLGAQRPGIVVLHVEAIA